MNNPQSLDKPFLTDTERDTRLVYPNSFGQSDEEILYKKVGFEKNRIDSSVSWRPSPIKLEYSLELSKQIEEEHNSPKFAGKLSEGKSSLHPPSKDGRKKLEESSILEGIAYESSEDIIEISEDEEEKLPDLDHFKSPPDLKYLKRHCQASEVGHFDIYDKNALKDTCACCNLPVKKDKLEINCKRSSLSFFGLGYSLYFEIIYQMFLALFFVFLVSGVYRTINIYRNCNNLNKKDCYGYFGITYSTRNEDADMVNLRWLDMISVLILIVAIVFLKDRTKSLHKDHKDLILKPSDFTIMIKNVPPETNEEEIKNFLKNFGFSGPPPSNLVINKVNFTYKIGEFIKLIRKKELLEIQKQKLTKKLSLKGEKDEKLKSSIEKFEKSINENNDSLKRLNQELKSSINPHVCSRAFVTINSQNACKKILKCWQVSPIKRFCVDLKSILGIKSKTENSMRGSNLIIQKAPEPLDIIWENLEISTKSKMLRRFFTYTMSLLIISSGFFAILQVSKAKELYNRESIDNYKGIMLSLLCSLIIALMNFLLRFIIELFSDFEKYACATEQEISIAFKLSLMQFINVALVPFFLFLLYKDIYAPKALLQNIFFVFLGNLIIEPIANFFDVIYFYNLVRRKWIEKHVDSSGLTNREAKQYFEGPTPQMAQKYAGITKNILTAAFFAPIFPIGLVFCLLALLVTYWLDKYLLLRRYAFPVNLSEDLAFSIMILLEFTPLLFSLGDLVYDTVMLEQNTNNIPNYFSVGISFIFLVLCISTNISFRCLWCKKAHNDEIILEEDECDLKNSNISLTKIEEDRYKKSRVTYEQAKLYLFTDYDRLNPITAAEAKVRWLKELEEGDIQPKYKKLLRNSTIFEGVEIKPVGDPNDSHCAKLYESIHQYAILSQKKKKSAFSNNLSKANRLKHSVILNQAYSYSQTLQSMIILPTYNPRKQSGDK